MIPAGTKVRIRITHHYPAASWVKNEQTVVLFDSPKKLLQKAPESRQEAPGTHFGPAGEVWAGQRDSTRQKPV